MRWLLLSLLLLFPLQMRAADTSACDAGTLECLCETDEQTDTIPVDDDTELCEEACLGYNYDSEVNWYLTCEVGGAWETVVSGRMEGESIPAPEPAPDFVEPNLIVDIPGLNFTDPTISNGYLNINYLGEYINAVYRWLIPAMTLVAVVMLMIAGLQYTLSRGNAEMIKKAKTRMSNAVIGLILLLLTYNIAFILNPATVQFSSLSIIKVNEIALDDSLTGEPGRGEGTASIYGATGTWENLSNPYKLIAQAAKNDTNLACPLPDGFTSPTSTGTLPNQGNHHWYDNGRNGDYKKIDALDWAAPWGSDIKAPFDGIVTYQKQEDTNNKCGNRIILTGYSSQIVICHAKDFLRANGKNVTGSVKQGEVIGHVGGVCCAGENAPSNWLTECTVTGTPCDPFSNTPCTCQPIEQAGNTSGPHVHATVKFGLNILSCLE